MKTPQSTTSFPWGMDDKAYFEGALNYIEQLRQTPGKPWMLTLLTVGTHQPYSAPADYLQRYSTPKQAGKLEGRGRQQHAETEARNRDQTTCKKQLFKDYVS